MTTQHRGPNEYAFEVRKAQPRDPGKAQPLTYWRRVLQAFDVLGEGESLFFRHQDEAPTDKKLTKMRGNIAGQMKRHRPERAVQIVRVPADGGVYLYAVATEDPKGTETGPPAPATEEAGAVQSKVLAGGGPAEVPSLTEQMAAAAIETSARLATRVRTATLQGSPVAEGFGGLRHLITEIPPARVQDPEEAEAFEDQGTYADPGVNPLTFKAAPAVCACNPAHGEPAMARRGAVWEDRGDWHEASCPLHAHRYVLPRAGEGSGIASDTNEGICRCGARKDFNKEATRTPIGTPIGTGTALPPTKGNSAMCPKCGQGFASVAHRACRAAAEAAKEARRA